MSASGNPTDRPKVVLVVGTTGAGKSRLAVDVAKAHNAEVINADSIQMYKGLRIATATVTEEEMDGIPHHLLSFLDPCDDFTVRDFRREASKIIRRLHAAGKPTVVVGGTMYYVQALMFNSLLDDTPDQAPAAGAGAAADAGAERFASDEERYSYDRLVKVDPVMATKLHASDSVKVRRAIEIFERTGRRQSDLYAAQLAALGAGDGPESEFDVRLLWVHTDRSTLVKRLDRRVDGMVAEGLVEEVRAFRAAVTAPPAGQAAAAAAAAAAASQGTAVGELEQRRPDRDRGVPSAAAQAGAPGAPKSDRLDSDRSPSRGAQQGVLRAIGYKEFCDYFDVLEAPAFDGEAPVDAAAAEAALHSSLEAVKTATRQYARTQIAWIRNRFQARGVPMLKLDSSDPSRWNDLCRDPAVEDVGMFLRGELKDKAGVETALSPGGHDQRRILSWKKFRCPACELVLNGATEWHIHLRGRKHRKSVEGQRRVARDLLGFTRHVLGLPALVGEGEAGRKAPPPSTSQLLEATAQLSPTDCAVAEERIAAKVPRLASKSVRWAVELLGRDDPRSCLGSTPEETARRSEAFAFRVGEEQKQEGQQQEEEEDR